MSALREFAAAQTKAGVTTHEVAGDRLHDLEPHLAPGLAGGFHYPQDAQVMPALAAAHLLRASGAEVRLGQEVTGLLTGPDGAVRGVRTATGVLHAPHVVNAAGTWGGELARLAGVFLPVLPRRGFVLVTEPLPRVVRHKVYAADYVADVASGSAALQTSPVVEGTPAGPVLIGASRERVGFDRTLSIGAVSRLAAGASALFPVLAEVRVLRTYAGFRPYLPDHLPAIGADARVPGLLHACGHEGAGIGLAPATGRLIAACLAGEHHPWGARRSTRGRFERAGRFEWRRAEFCPEEGDPWWRVAPGNWPGRDPVRRSRSRSTGARCPRCPASPSRRRCGRPASWPGAPRGSAAGPGARSAA